MVVVVVVIEHCLSACAEFQPSPIYLVGLRIYSEWTVGPTVQLPMAFDFYEKKFDRCVT
jgi:hypothetical protein